MKNIKYFLAIIVLAAVASGCIKETFPTSGATTEQIATSTSALSATVNAMPAQLSQGYLIYGEQEWEFDMAYPGIMMMLDHCTGDIVANGNTGYDWYSFWSGENFQLSSEYATSYVPWRTFYMFVKSSNDVIGAINPDEASELQLAYLGMAYAYRAFSYMNMACIYEFKPATDEAVDSKYEPENDITGMTVPIVTEATSQDQAKANPRANVDTLYDLIFSDLDFAEKYLEKYSATTTLLPSLPVVYGLKARAYLQRGTAGVDGAFAKAAEYARKAIDAKGGSPLTQDQWEDPVNGFNNASANSNSWMWHVAYSAETMGNLCNFVAHMSAEETWTSYGWAPARGLPAYLYKKIPDGDWRKHSWIDPDKDAYYKYKTNRDIFDDDNKPLPAYTSLKFRPMGGDYQTYSAGGASNVPLMRIEEMMLIEAEALAMGGNVPAAQTALNEFMQTRNPAYDCSRISDPEEFQQEVFFQKRIELWGEGLIFYDFKRLAAGIHNGYTGTNAQGGFKFNCEGVCPWWNWTIPDSEVNGNPVLKGYNNPTPMKTVTEWIEG